MRSPTALAAALVVSASAFTGVARADPTPPKRPAGLPGRAAGIALEKGVVKLSVSYRDAVDGEITKKLQNGLPTVIAMRAYLFRDGSDDPLALTARSCRVVYDLWEEVFRIQLVQPGGVAQSAAVNLEGVLRTCCDVKGLPLVDRALLSRGTTYYAAVLVEVNPVSAEMLDRIKLWVTRPEGATAIGPGDSLFGSFVGLFVARVGDAERRLAFRSAGFFPPEPPP